MFLFPNKLPHVRFWMDLCDIEADSALIGKRCLKTQLFYVVGSNFFCLIEKQNVPIQNLEKQANTNCLSLYLVMKTNEIMSWRSVNRRIVSVCMCP